MYSPHTYLAFIIRQICIHFWLYLVKIHTFHSVASVISKKWESKIANFVKWNVIDIYCNKKEIFVVNRRIEGIRHLPIYKTAYSTIIRHSAHKPDRIDNSTTAPQKPLTNLWLFVRIRHNFTIGSVINTFDWVTWNAFNCLFYSDHYNNILI